MELKAKANLKWSLLAITHQDLSYKISTCGPEAFITGGSEQVAIESHQT